MTLDWTVAKKCIGRYVITNAIQIEQLQNKWAISIKEQLFALDRSVRSIVLGPSVIHSVATTVSGTVRLAIVKYLSTVALA